MVPDVIVFCCRCLFPLAPLLDIMTGDVFDEDVTPDVDVDDADCCGGDFVVVVAVAVVICTWGLGQPWGLP